MKASKVMGGARTLQAPYRRLALIRGALVSPSTLQYHWLGGWGMYFPHPSVQCSDEKG